MGFWVRVCYKTTRPSYLCLFQYKTSSEAATEAVYILSIMFERKKVTKICVGSLENLQITTAAGPVSNLVPCTLCKAFRRFY